ncbi:MAG: hypothetical protein J6B32_00405 [Spirochaetaceae bacterium]|nr:hypothetical protein [Spirochaetaceae bacterium]
MKREPDFISNKNMLWDKSGRQYCFRGVSFCFTNNSSQNPPALELSLENADSYLSQLKQKGFNLIALQVFWKDIEQEGPEEYNEEYLAQLRLLLKKIEEYNISVIIQPVFGNWGFGTAEDGCPAWTLKLIGINPETIQINFQDTTEKNLNNKLQFALYQKYISSTMYTLFWAGKTFAPDFLVQGDNIQDYLQEHYISAMKHTARRIKDCNAVMGISFISRGDLGFVGINDLQDFSNYSIPMGKENFVCNTSAFEIIKNASGLQATYNVPQKIKLGILTQTNQNKTEGWEGGFSSGNCCPWEKLQIWHQTETKEAILDKPAYFSLKSKESFSEDYLKPFQMNFYDAFQKKHGRYLFLAESLSDKKHTYWEFGTEEMHKKLEAAEKEGGVIPDFNPEAEKIIFAYEIHSPEVNVFPQEIEKLGSCAIFYMFNFSEEIKKKISIKSDSLDIFFNYIDKNNLSFLLNANYTNQKELIFLEESIEVFSRPYILNLWGTLLNFSFQKKPNLAIKIEWMSLPQSLDEINFTEIFIPESLFPKGWKVEKFDGVGTVVYQEEKQTLLITTVTEQRCMLRIISK